MRSLALVTALPALAGCALFDAMSDPASGDGDADTDTDTDTDTDSDADTDTDSDSDVDLHDCFVPYRDADVCEDQKDHAAECATRDPKYDAAPCDPIDQCACVSPQACFPGYAADENPETTVVCADPGTGRIGDPCNAQTDCLGGLVCVNGQLTESGEDSCQRPCDDPCDCAEDEMCLIFTPNFCRRPELCDPADPDACPEGSACIFTTDFTRTTNATLCIHSLAAPQGADCDSINECDPGLLCAGAICRAVCRTDEDCASDCRPFEDRITGCDVEVRVCF